MGFYSPPHIYFQAVLTGSSFLSCLKFVNSVLLYFDPLQREHVWAWHCMRLTVHLRCLQPDPSCKSLSYSFRITCTYASYKIIVLQWFLRKCKTGWKHNKIIYKNIQRNIESGKYIKIYRNITIYIIHEMQCEMKQTFCKTQTVSVWCRGGSWC